MIGVLNARAARIARFDTHNVEQQLNKQYNIGQCHVSTVSQPNEQVAVLHCRTRERTASYDLYLIH